MNVKGYLIFVPFENVASMEYGGTPTTPGGVTRPDKVTVATTPGHLAGPFEVAGVREGYPYEVPEPGEPQCEADGVRNGPDGPGGTEHYWTCTAPGTVDVDGTLMCEDHAGERGHGPKQEEYGYEPNPEAVRMAAEDRRSE